MKISAQISSLRRAALLLLAATVLASCASAPTAPSSVVAELAPTGKLRAAINFGNPILAARDSAAGEARGVSVDLSRELARRLGVPLELVTYNAAGKVVEALKSGAWDVAYVAIDPVRANEISYSAAYVVIEGAYLVRQDSPIRSNAEVDRPGVRVAAATGSAYDLYLSRELKQAKIVRAATSPGVTDLFVAQGLEVAAGVKQQLEADAKRIPGLRLLDGRFMVINQAMGMPKARNGGGGEAGLAYLREFIEEMKASGFVAQALARHRIEGAAVAPPAK
jgi:polar amino acid transport system substrate-binding protein